MYKVLYILKYAVYVPYAIEFLQCRDYTSLY